MDSNSLKDFFKNKWFKFGLVALLYLLWVIWMRSWILLPGLIIIYDLYISRKVYWDFWNKYRDRKNIKWLVEWVDALVFALIAATFVNHFIFQLYAIPTSSLEKTLLVGDRLYVSKMAYGPRVPQTPIALPLMHNTIPGTRSTNSYLEWLQLDYKRLAGTTEIERNDIVVFNFPTGDTIIVGHENPDYYTWIRQEGRENIQNPNFWQRWCAQYGVPYQGEPEIKVRPVDKRENYVKRCVAMPGDMLEIIEGRVYINGQKEADYKGIQFNYIVTTDGTRLNPKMLADLQIAKEDIQSQGNRYLLPLNQTTLEALEKNPKIISIERLMKFQNTVPGSIYPFDTTFQWTKDDFGPLYIPKKGEQIELTKENLILYDRLISVYEGNKLEVKNEQVFINGEPATHYTFQMNYYWLMGDNRDNSADARMWGFVPEDHVVGKPIFVLFSLDKDKNFLGKIRFNRMFKGVDKLSQ